MDQTPLQQTVMETVETGASFPQEVATITNDETETTGTEERTYEPLTYDELFPALPMGAVAPSPNGARTEEAAPTSNWNMRIASTVVTQVFRVPFEERAKIASNGQFGESSREISNICATITSKTGARIEISSAKDQSLTFLVNGKNEEVLNAKKMVLEKFQTQARQTVWIPKEYHRFILGKKAKKLQEIETSTGTKIQVPFTNDASEEITVVGTKESAERAIHEIQVLYDEQSKQMHEKIDVPAMYHPFITYNEKLNLITAPGNVRIHIPPQGSGKTELTIAGEREGVIKCKEIIIELNAEMEAKCQTVSVEVKKGQHRHIIGPKGVNINEILSQSGVSVEMPPSDSPSETITLRGPQDKLGNALTMLYAKANSVQTKNIEAPTWLHKFIIGRKGVNIKQIMQELPKVHVEFTDKDGVIRLEGPGEEVEIARSKLQQIIDDMNNRLGFDEIVFDPQYHKHIIGKAGSNINRIRNENGININIEENDGKKVIRLEGNSTGVEEAKRELTEMLTKMENEIEADLAIEQRFHRYIIGTKGDKIREIRDRYNQVLISIPDPGEKSDVVRIRGPKDDVEQCLKYLKVLVAELAENNFQLRVSIFRQFYKFIIGKSGVNINKIREETNTRLELPSESSNSDEIVITGKKENCLKAKELIQKIQSEMANIVELEIIIPAKFHNSMIGAGGKLIQSISEECGGVSIKFPSPESKSDKVSLRGPKDDVSKAKSKLVELTNEKHLSSFTAEVKANPQLHRYLIGRNGVRIGKIRDKYGARVIFPNAKDINKEIITIIGKKESVEQAKKELEGIIKELALIVEDEIRVDLKHHRHFLAKRGEVIRNISDQFGGVTISFPRQGDPSDVVSIKGSKECVVSAKAKMQEMVRDLEELMSIVVVIPQKYHRTVMGMRGSLVQGIQSDFNVHIKFPDKDMPYSESYDENSEDVRPNDMVVVQGKQEDCAKAREALLALVPITQELPIRFKYHRYIIGPKGEYVKSLMNEYKVNIQVPPAHDYLDRIVVSGPPAYIKPAVDAINKKIDEILADEADRALRNFQVQVKVNPEYHPKIIGKKGAVISKIRDKHGVNIQFKPRGSMDDDIITITGYEENCKAAMEAILEITGDLDNMVKEPVEIDNRIFSRLIGVRGRAIKKIMEKFRVEIRFPHDNDNPNEVTISGKSENVEECKDHLLNLAEEYLQDISDNEEEQRHVWSSNQTQASPYQSANGQNWEAPISNDPAESGGGDFGSGGDGGMRGGSQKQIKVSKPVNENTSEDAKSGFVVQGAPWTQEAPNLDSSEDFPSMGAVTGSAIGGGPSIWGPRRS